MYAYNMYPSLSLYIYIYIYRYVCVCIMHIYKYMYIYIYTYTYICVWGCRLRSSLAACREELASSSRLAARAA